MSSTLPHISRTIELVRSGLHSWMAEKLREGNVDLSVTGSVTGATSPTLVLLPYQIVLESTPTNPSTPLMPVNQENPKDSLPPVWRRAGLLMTHILVDTFPARPAKGPGIGPVDPLPPLASLPKPIAAWYKAAGEDWLVERNGTCARLPMIEWQHAFSLAIRFAAIVPSGSKPTLDLDSVQLRALALVAAAVRLGRHFRVDEPPFVQPGLLLDLMKAFSKVDHADAEELKEAVAILSAPRELTVGLAPHHDLSDQDLALMMRAMELPMQPAIVFSLRVALGAGPALGHGAIPHLASVEGVRR